MAEAACANSMKRSSADSEQSLGGGKSGLPRKRFYRARAHSNPLSDSHFPVPVSPDHVDWAEHFPVFFKSRGKEMARCPESSSGDQVPGGCSVEDAGMVDRLAEGIPDGSGVTQSDRIEEEDRQVRFADVGCGFGGLLVKLSPMFPGTLMIGMELRDKVSEYVKERILALRKESPGQYENISIIRTNAMKYLPNYFRKGSLQKMFFLFPDPHFKEKNHRRRIISVPLLAEYAYAMAVGGILYTITDVPELADWMKKCLDMHPLFEEMPALEQESDPVVELLKTATEEGKKVLRNNGKSFQFAYRRVHS
eukprot:c26273_g1_i1 orf=526-1449(-)